MLTNDAKVDITLDDIKDILKNTNNTQISLGVASGSNAVELASKKIICSNEFSTFSKNATKAIILISSSKEIEIKDIDTIIEELVNLNLKKIKITFGITIDKEQSDDLIISVLASSK